jgi:pseudouridine-5'-monophosphatase
MPGAIRLIQHLYQYKIPMAICTNSRKEHVELKTKDRYWREMISLRVMAPSDPEVERQKPAPDSYLVTMKRFETKPVSSRNVLAFEGKL